MVKIFVAVTDKDWFDFLSGSQLDEVNFGRQSGRTNFRALSPGELFLFKLHAPLNFIVGGGIFSASSSLLLSLAWEAFGLKNGVLSLPEMRERIRRYRSDSLNSRIDPVIGCRILTSPFFWLRDLWLPVPANCKSNIVVGRGFDTYEGDGRALWDAVLSRTASVIFPADPEQPTKYGAPTLVKPRLGQGAFRVVVTDA